MFEPDRCPKCGEHLTYVLRSTMKYQCRCEVARERIFGLKNARRVPFNETRRRNQEGSPKNI